jgi:hypothetical protein
LLAQVAPSSFPLPKLDVVYCAARALLSGSLMLAILSLFFIVLQQREWGMYVRPAQFRTWLCGKGLSGEKLESSVVAHQLLRAPLEMLGVSLTMFIVGLGEYEGSAAARHVGLN